MINTLKTIFADLDLDCRARQEKWALETREALRAFTKSDEYKAFTYHDGTAKYARLHAIAGGKGWYGILQPGTYSTQGIIEYVAKNCAAIADRRNASIIKKITKKGATSIGGLEFARTSDGLHGTFVISTDAGNKAVTIDTIVAGGYNIQCLHQRTLVKIR